MKRPAFQFYPGDWQRDAALRSCSVAARGLWMEMLCIMHQGEPYGYLVINGKPVTPEQLSRMVGASVKDITRWWLELQDGGVFSCEDGKPYSRRMVRDEELRNSRAESGHLGGNPKLTSGYNKAGYLYAIRRESDGAIKIGIAINPTNRLYKLRQACKPDELTLLDCIEVADMGVAELKAHETFSAKKVMGEWFTLNDDDLLTLGFTLNLQTKGKATPSSSVFSLQSSSSKSKASTARKKRAARTPLPADFCASDRVRAWAMTRNFDRVEEHCEAFISKAKAKGYQYVDWDEALMNAIRDDWAGLRTPKNGSRVSMSWATSNEGIEAKGREVGLYPRGGESYRDYAARIAAALDQHAAA